MARVDPLVFKFGQPLFGAAWPCGNLLLVAGGGGKPGSGIENRIIAARHIHGALTDEVASVRLKSACEKIAVSPNSNIILAVTQQAVVPYALFTGNGAVEFIMPQKSIVEAFTSLQQRVTALRYSSDGRLLVLGTEAGNILVLQASRYRQLASHQLRISPDADPVTCEIKDMDVCTVADDPACLRLCLSADNGNGYVATLKITTEHEMPTASEIVSCMQLNKPKRIENGSFKHSRFAGSDVVASINYRGNGYVCRWQALRGGLFRQAALSRAVPAAITGLDVSPSGSLLGLANAEGHSLLLQSSSLAVSLRNKKAHMVFGTDVAFAPHSGAFLSVSGDASARVNLVPAPQSAMALLVRIVVLLCLALVALVVLDHMGMLQGELGRRLSPVAQSVRSVADTAAEGLSLRIRSVLHSRSITM